MVSPAAVSVAVPDPRAALPAGDPIKVQGAPASAPLSPGRRVSQAHAEMLLSGRKPLRRPKTRIPRAQQIDPEAELTRGQVVSPAAHAPRALAADAAPAVCVPLSAPFQVGEDDDTTIPPDTNAAVSKTHILATHNNNVSIFDRNGTLISQTSLNSFWQGVGISGHTFDPKVVYDAATDRFYFATMADAELQTSRLLIACSASGDPTQQWKPYAVQVDSNAQGAVWMDYPSLGFSDDKITVTVNLYTLAGNAFQAATVYAFDKASLVNAAATVLAQRFVLTNLGGTHAPAVTQPGSADQLIVSTWASNADGQGALLILRLSGKVTSTGGTTLTRQGFVQSAMTWESFPPVPDFAPQSVINDRISVGDDRMLSVTLRDGTLTCVHMALVPAGTPTTCVVQCWDIPVATWTPSVFRIEDPDGAFLTNPSHAVNDRGDKLIGCSFLSANTHPSGGYYCVPSGGTPQPANVFAGGTATYLKMFGGGQNRWGDYSATMTDPENDRDFWTVQACSEPPLPGWPEPGRWLTKMVQVGAPPAVVAGAGP